MEDRIGSRIKAARERAGLTQEDLAERMEVSRQAVSKWEADLSRPSSENLLRLCKLLGLDWEELAGGTEELAVPEEPEPAAPEVLPEKKRSGWKLLAEIALPIFIAVGALLLIFLLENPKKVPAPDAPPPVDLPTEITLFPEGIPLTAKEVRDFGISPNGGEKVPAAEVRENQVYVYWFPGPYLELAFYLRRDEPDSVLFAVYTDDPEGEEDYTVITSLAEGADRQDFMEFSALGHTGCKAVIQDELGTFNYYFTLDEDGVPELYFVVDGKTFELDIDADGENEIITPESGYLFYDRGMDDYWAYQVDGELPEGFILELSDYHLFDEKLVPGEAACSKNALTDLLCPDAKDTVFTFTYTGEMYDSAIDPDQSFQNPEYPTHRQLAYMAAQTLYELTGVRLERCYAHATDHSVYLSTDRRYDFGSFFTFSRDPRWAEYEKSVGGFMLTWKSEYEEDSPIDPALFQIPGETEEERCLWLYDHARFFNYGEIVDIGWDIDTRLFLEDGSFFEVSSNTNNYTELRGPYPEGFSH